MFAVGILNYGVELEVVKGLGGSICFALLCCGGGGWHRSF